MRPLHVHGQYRLLTPLFPKQKSVPALKVSMCCSGISPPTLNLLLSHLGVVLTYIVVSLPSVRDLLAASLGSLLYFSVYRLSPTFIQPLTLTNYQPTIVWPVDWLMQRCPDEVVVS